MPITGLDTRSAPPGVCGPGGAPGSAPRAGEPVVLVVAAALLDVDGRVLIARRPQGKFKAGLFPGGKIGGGETPEQALTRDLREELDVEESCLSPFTFASRRCDDFHLLMPLYVCRKWGGRVNPMEGQQVAWVKPTRLDAYPSRPPTGR